jgi:two-component system, chemotaxis family, chemotaxis protein CheY
MSAPARVFVVEDSADLRWLYRLMLERAGYELVGEADNCATALARAPDLEPDIIVLDVLLPDVNGIEVARLLRTLLPGVTIVLCSGAGRDVAAEAADVGASGWLDKGQLHDLVPLLDRLTAGQR